jgi:small subunit ribosomal protein S17
MSEETNTVGAATSGAVTPGAASSSAASSSAATSEGEASAPRKRRLIGRVASDKMHKTLVLEVVRYKMDRMYKKYVKVRKRYQVHDENNEYRVGDRIEVIEHRPISKHKRWKVLSLIERAPVE